MGIPQINEELKISDYLYDPSRDIYASIRTIHPKVAEQILQAKASNRAISRSTVSMYAKFMTDGCWILNGQPIIFSDNVLIDGQHRLSACVKSRIPLEALVVEIGDRRAFRTLDQGKRRSGADVLGIDGYTNTSVLYSALCILEKIARDGELGYNQTGGSAKVTIANHEIDSIVTKYPGIEESTKLARTFVKGLKTRVGPIAVLHYLLRQTELEYAPFGDKDASSFADQFMDTLATGMGLQKGDPILYFRNALIKRISEKEKTAPHYIIRGGILTWNNWIRNKKVTKFVLKADPRIPSVLKPL